MTLGKKILWAVLGIFFVYLTVSYVLPVVFPFLLGAALAFVSEPLVRRIQGRCSRSVAAGFGVTLTLLTVAVAVYFLSFLAVGQLKKLATVLPDLESTAHQGVQMVQDFFVELSQQAPESVRPFLERTALDFFDADAGFLHQLGQKVPGVFTSAISRVGNGAVSVGVGILSAFLFSVRLPKFKKYLREKLPDKWVGHYRPMLKKAGNGITGWLKAQGKLALVSWGILTAGFFLLKIPYAPMWALAVAAIDAVPVLGTGTVLLPWALVRFLQGDTLQSIGLVCIYAATALTRTVLEPKVVGRHLGLDPLVTLVALYLGYRFWGIWGMLLAPIAASMGASLMTRR